jgi:hypothetical protein
LCCIRQINKRRVLKQSIKGIVAKLHKCNFSEHFSFFPSWFKFSCRNQTIFNLLRLSSSTSLFCSITILLLQIHSQIKPFIPWEHFNDSFQKTMEQYHSLNFRNRTNERR